MIHTTRWQTAYLGTIVVLMLATAPLGYAQADTTPMLHAAGHHGPGCSGGSPTLTTCNAGMDQGSSGMGMSLRPSGDMASMMDLEAFDLLFIDMVIVHHESAIAMATVVLDESSDPILIEIAEDIIGTQSGEIEKLQEWRERWYRTSPSFAATTMPGMADIDHLRMMGIMDPDSAARILRTAPETVDRAFANAMILHHQGVTMLFEMAVLHAGHPEIAGLAGTMLEAHHEQAKTLQDWQLA